MAVNEGTGGWDGRASLFWFLLREASARGCCKSLRGGELGEWDALPRASNGKWRERVAIAEHCGLRSAESWATGNVGALALVCVLECSSFEKVLEPGFVTRVAAESCEFGVRLV